MAMDDLFRMDLLYNMVKKVFIYLIKYYYNTTLLILSILFIFIYKSNMITLVLEYSLLHHNLEDFILGFFIF